MTHWTITDKKDVKTSEILAKVRELFPVYVYDEKDLDKQFPAPKKDLTLNFKKSYEADPEHKNKSYDDFMAEKDRTFMNIRQYLLLCIKVWKEEKKHLDVVGWTRLSSLWSDGYLVYGYWYDAYAELYLFDGSRAHRNPDDGPRSAVSLDPQSSNPLEIRVKSLEEDMEKIKKFLII